MNDPQRPIGVQLFCGPTGVGKTEMAKALADYMFGAAHGSAHSAKHGVDQREQARRRLIRLDMSEYAGPGAAARMLFQADGQPSKLIQEVRKQPLVVVLLDEIEKASPEVFDVLMGVFDEGRLTDRWGRVTDFRSSILIMTSNLGVRQGNSIGFADSRSEGFERAVREFFRPEFYNRFDTVVSFQPLDRESIEQITRLELEKVANREGLKKRNIRLHWDARVVQELSRLGFDPRMGARPLQRVIESRVVTLLARRLAEEPDMQQCSLRLEWQEPRFILSSD